MKFHFSALFVLVPIQCFSQGSRVPLDKSFIDKTIEYYYTSQASKHKGASVFYVEKDSLTQNAKTDYGKFKVQFLSPEEAVAKLPVIRKEEVKLDRLLIKWISLDTIDVVITGCTIGQRKVSQVVDNKPVTRTENFLSNCTEAIVDVPTCRFVYNPTNTKWTQVNRGKDVK